MRKIVLASSSPRRKEILDMTGLKFTVCASDYKEELDLSLKPGDLAKFLSCKKAEHVAGKYEDALIIAADTFIVCGDSLLGKPRTEKEAVAMLKMLNGRSHHVITGYTVLDTGSGKKLSKTVKTKVYFRNMEREEIAAYVATKEPLDKAGAYAIQGGGAVFIEKIEGDFFNVVGLPLCALIKSLREFGIHVLR